MVLIRRPGTKRTQIQFIGEKQFDLLEDKEAMLLQEFTQQVIQFLSQTALDRVRPARFSAN